MRPSSHLRLVKSMPEKQNAIAAAAATTNAPARAGCASRPLTLPHAQIGSAKMSSVEVTSKSVIRMSRMRDATIAPSPMLVWR